MGYLLLAGAIVTEIIARLSLRASEGFSRLGFAAVAVLSIPLFGESLSPIQVGGLVLVIVGVVALQAGGAR